MTGTMDGLQSLKYLLCGSSQKKSDGTLMETAVDNLRRRG